MIKLSITVIKKSYFKVLIKIINFQIIDNQKIRFTWIGIETEAH